MTQCDLAIIGGGIVGLATAYQVQRARPDCRITVLEKEPSLGQHQTGHNSGVLHTGIYYKPGSQKAKNCIAGKLAMQEFCAQHAIPFEVCGKVIVATQNSELLRMQDLYERGKANGVACSLLDRDQLRELEPHCAGIQAIHVTEAGIVDYPAVVQALAKSIGEAGGKILTGCKVRGIREDSDGVVLETSDGTVQAKQMINCAGLYSDRVARHTVPDLDLRIVPFRGEYYKFKANAPRLCKNLIYPVPDPAFPFLGVHFTRMINGETEAGPNAVLALAREGYRKSNVHLPELLGTLCYPGFLRLAAKYWRMGCGEMWRSFNKGAFVRALQRLIPEVESSHLEPAPAGVRAQAISRDGKMLDDFSIQQKGRIIHVCNAPSPAATASLSIGAHLASLLPD